MKWKGNFYIVLHPVEKVSSLNSFLFFSTIKSVHFISSEVALIGFYALPQLSSVRKMLFSWKYLCSDFTLWGRYSWILSYNNNNNNLIRKIPCNLISIDTFFDSDHCNSKSVHLLSRLQFEILFYSVMVMALSFIIEKFLSPLRFLLL